MLRSLSRFRGNNLNSLKISKITLSTGSTTTTNSEADIDKALRSDVKKLGLMLGDVIKAESQDVFESVEKLRKLGREVSSIIF